MKVTIKFGNFSFIGFAVHTFWLFSPETIYYISNTPQLFCQPKGFAGV
jgi:hypothetical protein